MIQTKLENNEPFIYNLEEEEKNEFLEEFKNGNKLIVNVGTDNEYVLLIGNAITPHIKTFNGEPYADDLGRKVIIMPTKTSTTEIKEIDYNLKLLQKEFEVVDDLEKLKIKLYKVEVPKIVIKFNNKNIISKVNYHFNDPNLSSKGVIAIAETKHGQSVNLYSWEDIAKGYSKFLLREQKNKNKEHELLKQP